MAKKRTLTRHCARCDKVLYGFDDDVELGPLNLPADHDMARFSGAYMCAGCFESWPSRESFGRLQAEYVLEECDSKGRAVVHCDENCVLLLDIRMEVLSWKPVEIKYSGPGALHLLLQATGTKLTLELSTWGKEAPKQKGDKRLLKCEQEAVLQVWDNLVRQYPTAEALMSTVNPNEVVARHREWLQRERD